MIAGVDGPMDRPDDPAFWPDESAWVAADDGGWITPEEVEAELDSLEGARSERVDLGLSLGGRPITALRVGSSEPLYALRILGGHHGNEPISVIVALAVAERLVADPALVPGDAEVWIVPDVNPDGLAAHTRENALGVDLNRNYDYEWGDAVDPGAEPFSEPETRAIRALTRARSWLGGLTLHSGASNISWTWNYTTAERAPDEPLLAAIGEVYAADTREPEFWSSNGADWYPTHGDTTDWSYGRWGLPEFTLELCDDKSPDDIQTVIDWHVDAILSWIARRPDLLAEAVSDQTGEFLPVTADTAWPTTSPTGTLARWSDTTPPTWTSAGFDSAAYGDALVWSGATVTPRLSSRGDGAMDVPTGWLGLTQPGEAPVTFDGTLDASTLAPGLWDVVTTDGVAPRSLLVGEVDDHVLLDTVTVDRASLTLTGTGFGRGAEAWGIGGPVRALHPLERTSQTETELRFDWVPGDDTVLLWTNGAWVGAVGMNTTPDWDDDPPETVVIDGTPAEETELGSYFAGGCGGTGGRGALVFLGLSGLRRRRASRAVRCSQARRGA